MTLLNKMQLKIVKDFKRKLPAEIYYEQNNNSIYIYLKNSNPEGYKDIKEIGGYIVPSDIIAKEIAELDNEDPPLHVEIGTGVCIVLEDDQFEKSPREIIRVVIEGPNLIFEYGGLKMSQLECVDGTLKAVDDEPETDESHVFRYSEESDRAYIEVLREHGYKRVYLAENVAFDLNRNNHIVGIWLLNCSKAIEVLSSKYTKFLRSLID